MTALVVPAGMGEVLCGQCAGAGERGGAACWRCGGRGYLAAPPKGWPEAWRQDCGIVHPHPWLEGMIVLCPNSASMLPPPFHQFPEEALWAMPSRWERAQVEYSAMLPAALAVEAAHGRFTDDAA